MKANKNNKEMQDTLLALVSDGAGLLGACKKMGIDRIKVRRWVAADAGFARCLEAARRDGYEVWADQILTIGDEVAGAVDPATVNAARLAVDSRKWLLSKMRPELYGDKVELTGKDGAPLLPAPEAQIPRLMQVLAVLLPDSGNSELHGLASTMAAKLQKITPPGNGNGHDE
jgi:hypothetical protein